MFDFELSLRCGAECKNKKGAKHLAKLTAKEDFAKKTRFVVDYCDCHYIVLQVWKFFTFPTEASTVIREESPRQEEKSQIVK